MKAKNDIQGDEAYEIGARGAVERVRPEPAVTAWQNRPPEEVCPFVLTDAIHYKVKDITKAAYVVLGITVDGRKDIPGVWIREHENSKFWLNVLNDLSSRGVKDVYPPTVCAG